MSEKLVRDGMPAICNRPGFTPMTYRIASKKEMPQLLLAKLKEEVSELELAMLPSPIRKVFVIEELADIREALDALEILLDIDDYVQAKQAEKAKDRGGFSGRIVWDGKK